MLNNTAKPKLRGHFHQAMFFVFLGACSMLISLCKNDIQNISVIIYSIALLCMFGISSLYHRIDWTSAKRFFMKRLDHAGIYIMIAGSFTPICMLALPKEFGLKLLIIIWIIAALGIIQSIFFVNIPKMFSSILYLIMGYLIIPYLPTLYHSLGVKSIFLLLAGGISYSIGAIAYGIKRPVFKPSFFGYHEFFHVMVNLGAIFHFILIYTLIK